VSNKTNRTILTLDTLEEALGQLAGVPDSDLVKELRAQGEDLRREMQAWTNENPPSAEEREAMMKRVLQVYMHVQKLAKP
jgi:hypothetical protein